MGKIVRPESAITMPKEARRVFSGEVFDIYQWQQQMFDGSYHTYEKVVRTDSVIVIPVTKEGKIIITEQEQPCKKPYTDFPGGILEQKEAPEEGARRELLEETGYEAGELVLWHAIQPAARIEWAIYTFIAYDCQKKTDQKLDPGEKIKLKLINFDEFIEITTGDKLRDSETKIRVLNAKLDTQKMDELKKLFLR